MYDTASTEPLDVIRANECEASLSLATRRFQALWNEIERLRSLARELHEGMIGEAGSHYLDCDLCERANKILGYEKT